MTAIQCANTGVSMVCVLLQDPIDPIYVGFTGVVAVVFIMWYTPQASIDAGN
jgi:hypothetical protein